MKTAQEIKVGFTDALDRQNGTGIVTDTLANGAADKNHWVFTIDGVYFDITVNALSHATALTDKTVAKVHVDGTTIKVSSTYASETSLTQALLEAELNIPAGASIAYDAATMTATVTAACGHTAAYTVTFVEGNADGSTTT